MARVILNKYFPEEITRLILEKTLPDKNTERDSLFQNIITKHHNKVFDNDVWTFCLKCNLPLNRCHHLSIQDRENNNLHTYAVNYNIMRIMSGMSGLRFSA